MGLFHQLILRRKFHLRYFYENVFKYCDIFAILPTPTINRLQVFTVLRQTSSQFSAGTKNEEEKVETSKRVKKGELPSDSVLVFHVASEFPLEGIPDAI